MTKRSKGGVARMIEQETVYLTKPAARVYQQAVEKAKAASRAEFGGALLLAAAKAYLEDADGPKDIHLVKPATSAEAQTILGGGYSGSRKRTTRFE